MTKSEMLKYLIGLELGDPHTHLQEKHRWIPAVLIPKKKVKELIRMLQDDHAEEYWTW